MAISLLLALMNHFHGLIAMHQFDSQTTQSSYKHSNMKQQFVDVTQIRDIYHNYVNMTVDLRAK